MDGHEYESVDVWVGLFASEERLQAYLEETYDDDERPISEFARDQGTWFYDHDFMARSFGDTGADLGEALGGHSFSSSFVTEAEHAYQAVGKPELNCVLLVWNEQIEAPTTAGGDGYTLHYIGRFRCDPKAAPVESRKIETPALEFVED